uniref:Uncharacterized protein n=1 Tax=Parascaris univalens TaxID=6257 RepID=A0A915BF44_PARUN
IEAGGIPAGAVAIIVIAAIAIGIGFMTLLCSLINVAKNHRRAARLQSLSAERVISPGACPSLGRRLPSLAGTGGHFVLSFIPHPLPSPTPPSASERTHKSFATVAEAPPSYEEALR